MKVYVDDLHPFFADLSARATELQRHSLHAEALMLCPPSSLVLDPPFRFPDRKKKTSKFKDFLFA